MRNVFDQYKQLENQLSHSLATVLSLEDALCHRFAAWLMREAREKSPRLEVVQQRIPGMVTDGAETLEQRGLPDICISAGDEWCLAIECKVGASITLDQLDRHERSVKRCFSNVEVAAITAEVRPSQLPRGLTHRTWAEVYVWMGLQKERDHWWVRQLREFMRLLEARMLNDQNHLPAPLTMFDGIPFGPDHPYHYHEAKLLIRQVIPLLRNGVALRQLGIDPSCRGRKAITGKEASVVWDFISLKPEGCEDSFTDWPHLTFGIHADRTEVMVTMPNSVNGKCRKAFRDLGAEGFQRLAVEISDGMLDVFGEAPGYKPVMRIVHRHYASLKSKPVVDGEMVVDLRAAVEGGRGAVKAQPHWFAAGHHLLTDRKGCNLQLQMGAYFSHSGKMVSGADAVSVIEKGFAACAPLIEVLMREG